MSGYFGSSPSSGGGYFGGGKGAKAAPVPAPRHGVLGFISNLTHDIRDAAVGIPTGIVSLAEHPIRGVETIGKSTWQDWSPLFHGHVGQWAHNVYDHPLAPILDLSAVFTLGGSVAAKGGEALATLGAISDTSRLARLGEAGKILYHAPADQLAAAVENGAVLPPDMIKYTSANPVVRMRQVAFHAISQKLETQLPSWYAKSPLGTEGKYAGRLQKEKIMRSNTLQGLQVKQLADNAQMETMYHAGKLIDNAERGVLTGSTQASTRVLQKDFYGNVIPGQATSLDIAQRTVFKFNHGNVARHAFHIEDNGAKRAPTGFTFVRQSPVAATSEDFLRHMHETGGALTPVDNKYYAAVKGDTFEDRLRDGLRPQITTGDAGKAMRDSQGNLLVVPTKDLSHLATEAAGSARLLKKLYLSPFRTWKRLQIGYSPKTVMNVSVGNMLMLMADQGGANLARGLYHTVRADKGQAVADAGIRNLTHGHSAIEQHFGTVIHSTHAQSLAEDTSLLVPTKTRIGKIAREGIYPLVHRSEQFTKRWQIHAELRSAPAVKKLMRQGHTFKDASTMALNADHALVDRITQKVLATGGDYINLTPGEHMIRNVIPFYSWDKHMLSHARQLLTDRPHVAAPLAATGTYGTHQTQQILGNIPDFMKSALPLSMLGIHRGTGRVGILQTSGLNPYSTGADIADLAQQLTTGGTLKPGDIVAGQLNPLITHGIEQISGHQLNTDAAVKRHGGFFSSVLASTVSDLPEAKLAGTEIFGAPQPKPNSRTGKTTPFLYKKDEKTNVASWLGIPIKQVDLNSAEAQFQKQQTALAPKSKKKKKPTLFGGG